MLCTINVDNAMEYNTTYIQGICIIKAVNIDAMSWEGLAADRTKWKSALKEHLKTG